MPVLSAEGHCVKLFLTVVMASYRKKLIAIIVFIGAFTIPF
jgi:hypothetical protein